jgi:hypothetical protein
MGCSAPGSEGLDSQPSNVARATVNIVAYVLRGFMMDSSGSFYTLTLRPEGAGWVADLSRAAKEMRPPARLPTFTGHRP